MELTFSTSRNLLQCQIALLDRTEYEAMLTFSHVTDNMWPMRKFHISLPGQILEAQFVPFGTFSFVPSSQHLTSHSASSSLKCESKTDLRHHSNQQGLCWITWGEVRCKHIPHSFLWRASGETHSKENLLCTPNSL